MKSLCEQGCITLLISFLDNCNPNDELDRYFGIHLIQERLVESQCAEACCSLIKSFSSNQQFINNQLFSNVWVSSINLWRYLNFIEKNGNETMNEIQSSLVQGLLKSNPKYQQFCFDSLVSILREIQVHRPTYLSIFDEIGSINLNIEEDDELMDNDNGSQRDIDLWIVGFDQINEFITIISKKRSSISNFKRKAKNLMKQAKKIRNGEDHIESLFIIHPILKEIEGSFVLGREDLLSINAIELVDQTCLSSYLSNSALKVQVIEEEKEDRNKIDGRRESFVLIGEFEIWQEILSDCQLFTILQSTHLTKDQLIHAVLLISHQLYSIPSLFSFYIQQVIKMIKSGEEDDLFSREDMLKIFQSFSKDSNLKLALVHNLIEYYFTNQPIHQMNIDYLDILINNWMSNIKNVY